jgi:hypothetical protein
VALRVALTTALPAGCDCYGHPQHRAGDLAWIGFPGSDDTLHFIEADDEGWCWEPAGTDATLRETDASVATPDTFMQAFVHGWHHSAACCDGNLEGFKDVVATTRNGMFSTPLIRFLTRYAGSIEAKRFMSLVLPDPTCPSTLSGEQNARADFCSVVE